jgi:transcriptional regulator with XRE-family HTH domain
VSEKKAKTYYKDSEAMKLVGEKIREIRLSKKVSIEALANECEVDTSQIGRMELGKVNFSISYLYRIAKALNIHPKELIP